MCDSHSSLQTTSTKIIIIDGKLKITHLNDDPFKSKNFN